MPYVTDISKGNPARQMERQMRNLTDEQREIYKWGATDALHFRADPYRDLYQDVFKAETSEYLLRVSYNDPEGAAYLTVKFKNYGERYDREIEYASAREAIERAIRFVAEHPAPRPCCLVDY